MTENYKQLLTLSREIYALRSAAALLGWDQEVMMPSRGGESRAEALASISKVIQEKYCAPQLGEAISACEAQDESPEQAAVVQALKRDREKLQKIPPSLTEAIARTTSLTQQAWSEARPRNDAAGFNVWLEKIVDLRLQEAECLGYKKSPYEAMMDKYEPETELSEVASMLDDLKKAITPLLYKIVLSQHKPASDFLQRDYPIAAQEAFGRQVLNDITFNLKAGRLDTSAHPFTEGVAPTDVRLTTRYNARNPLSSLFGIIHEGGHGLYEQGFAPQNFGTPLAEAVSLGIHESQSRLWENQVGRSIGFWEHYFPLLKETFPSQLQNISLPQFYAAINTVLPSLIRVEADEVTYNLHIILRFELETALFNRDLNFKDLEAEWENKMEHLLGIKPDSASNGYMQDVHWSAGLFGYFPTYSLGNVYGAQLFDAAGHDIPGLESQISSGNFHPLRKWLQEKVHQHGRRYSAPELIKNATGQKPDVGYFVNYLKKKYGDLYHL